MVSILSLFILPLAYKRTDGCWRMTVGQWTSKLIQVVAPITAAGSDVVLLFV
jgi:hypothetical protein